MDALAIELTGKWKLSQSRVAWWGMTVVKSDAFIKAAKSPPHALSIEWTLGANMFCCCPFSKKFPPAALQQIDDDSYEFVLPNGRMVVSMNNGQLQMVGIAPGGASPPLLHERVDGPQEGLGAAQTSQAQSPQIAPGQVTMESDRRMETVPKSIKERLAELDSLRDEGIITEDEYSAKRADIINQI